MAWFRRTITEATPNRDLVVRAAIAENNVEILAESLADLELALEDRGWRSMSDTAQQEFTLPGLKAAAGLARILATANPLIKRGLGIRHGYIFGRGVQLLAKPAGDDKTLQDLGPVIDRFTGDLSNKRSFTNSGAQEEWHRTLGTDGNLFTAGFTSPRTGRVQVRVIPFDEITNIITNPDDRSEPWFYERTYWPQILTSTGILTPGALQVVYHPALNLSANAPRWGMINGRQIRWDAPVHHLFVNRVTGWKFGIGDAYAGMAWARSYKDFLGDWATLVKALSRYAWQTQVKGSKVAKTAQVLQTAQQQVPIPGGQPYLPGQGGPGATYVAPMGESLEAIPKTGATIDSKSGDPLARMVAASLGIPVTELLGDPGTTGARAVAETLAPSTRLGMQARQELLDDMLRSWMTYVVEQAVLAPAGGLRGSYTIDSYTGERVVKLAGDQKPVFDIDWPNLNDDNTLAEIQAIVAADATGKVPGQIIARLLMNALRVDDVDTQVDKMTDAEGNFIDPAVSAGQVAVDAFRVGSNPYSVM